MLYLHEEIFNYGYTYAKTSNSQDIQKSLLEKNTKLAHGNIRGQRGGERGG